MDTPRPPGPPRLLVLLALVLPLLSACGAAAASTSALSIVPTASAGYAAATAASGAGGAVISSTAATAAPAAAEATAAPATDAAPVDARVTAAAEPTPQPDQVAHQDIPLRAGATDDNAEFAAYQAYANAYYGEPVYALDISERYILTVRDATQQPVLDAQVQVFDGQRQVFSGRTYAGGKTIFFPRALGVAPETDNLRVQIEKNGITSEAQLARGQDGTQTFVLDTTLPTDQALKLDVLFLLDATGSMGDEIYQVQRTIRSVAERISGLAEQPQLRFGLVAYRDHGDDYVTKVYDFTSDVAVFQETLRGINADGGGDEPEALTEALAASVGQLDWAQDAVRLTFLVADAPPHIANSQDSAYLAPMRDAVASGIKIYPIAASNTSPQAEYVFRQMAQQTGGRFIFLTYGQGQSSGTPGDTTTMQVDPEAFTVDRLDDIVVLMVERELAAAVGAE